MLKRCRDSDDFDQTLKRCRDSEDFEDCKYKHISDRFAVVKLKGNDSNDQLSYIQRKGHCVEKWMLVSSALEHKINAVLRSKNSLLDVDLDIAEIIRDAEWLSGGNLLELEDVLLFWKHHHASIWEMSRLVSLLKELKLVAAPHSEPTHDYLTSLIFPILVQYQDLVAKDGLYGLYSRIYTLEMPKIICEFEDFMVAQILVHLKLTFVDPQHPSLLDNDLENNLKILFDCLELLCSFFDLIGISSRAFDALFPYFTQLCLSYLKDLIRTVTRHNTELRTNEAKIAYFYQQIVKVLKYQRRNTRRTSRGSSMSSEISQSESSSHFSVLVHPMIEAGLLICELATKERPAKPSFTDYIVGVAYGYTLLVGQIIEPILSRPIQGRLQVLFIKTETFALSSLKCKITSLGSLSFGAGSFAHY